MSSFRRSSTSQRVLLVLIGSAAALVSVELGLRVLAAQDGELARLLHEWDPDAAEIEPLGEHCYRAKPSHAYGYPNGAVAHSNRMRFRGPEVEVPKPPGVFRIVLLGGSTIHGWSVDDNQTIDAHLRAWLNKAWPQRRVEVVNLGLDGIDLLCEFERLRLEGLALEPDVVILHSGINDVVAASLDGDDPVNLEGVFRRQIRAGLDARVKPGLWRRLKHELFVARAPGLALQLAHRERGTTGPPNPPEQGLDRFASLLRRLAALPPPTTAVLFSSPPSALRFPGESRSPPSPMLVVDAETTQRYRDALDGRMRQVAAEVEASGRRATYVAHDVPLERFFDDCHLDGEGNRLVAVDFGRALVGLVGVP